MNPGRLTRLILVFWFAMAVPHPATANGLVGAIPPVGFRLERVAVPGGAEIITLFGKQVGGTPEGERQDEIPILSVLRDTLRDSDPANDRLRQVWVYSHAKPSLWQKLTAGLPFFYFSTSKNRTANDGLPAPLLDLGNPRKGMWRNLTEVALQAQVFDGVGMPLRVTTRSYRGNVGDYREMHLWQAATAVSAAESAAGQSASAGGMEFSTLGARLVLATRPLGGLVSEKYLQVAWDRQNEQSSLNRGHNWELLRQKAEENNLRFQPLSLAGQKDNFALLWMERPSPATAAPKTFDGRFLGISNPFTRKSLCQPDAYTQTWHMDSEGNRVTEDRPGASAIPMEPLALYALDHPRVPLLLVDFCNPHRPGTGERLKRFTVDLTVNVLGLTSLSSWQYLLVKSSFMFVRRRHGEPLDRSARTRAHAQLRYSLKFDNSLDPDLRSELERNLGVLGLNPLGVGLSSEVSMAHRQYAALVQWAKSPEGLTRKVEKDRARELAGVRHSRGVRILFGLAHIGTLGLYAHGDDLKGGGLEALDLQRRFAYQRRFLERVLASGPQPEVAWNPEAVGRSVDAVSELGLQGPKVRSNAVKLLSAVMRETDDVLIRRQCEEGLQKLGAAPHVNLASLHAAPHAEVESYSTEIGSPLTGAK
jgi:hypothetical protein